MPARARLISAVSTLSATVPPSLHRLEDLRRQHQGNFQDDHVLRLVNQVRRAVLHPPAFPNFPEKRLGLNVLPKQIQSIRQHFVFSPEVLSSVTRFWPRLTCLFCLAVYLLANTGTSLAVESWIKRVTKETTAVASAVDKKQPGSHQSTPEPKKCKNCSGTQVTEIEETVDTRSKPHDCEGPCDEECPCCPKDSGHHCPCHGGCAICNPATAPCLAPVCADLCDLQCSGKCDLTDCSPYLSLLTGGLDRPPRA
jgi:hypothetical protein